MNIKHLISLSLVFGWITCSKAQTFKSEVRHQQNFTKHIVVKNTKPVRGFFTKYVDYDGIKIRSAAVVSDSALLIAANKIQMMLTRMPVAKSNLSVCQVELHIIGKDQYTSDLPEFRHLKGVIYKDEGLETDMDSRTRGMAGPLYASCGEENLLRLPQDRYSGGYDICIHEFAHTIMSTGLDSTIRKKIQDQYDRSIAKGLWKGVYASADPTEYWAELTTWYFGFHGEFTSFHYLKGYIPTAGSEGLNDYDPEGFKLLDSIYSGQISPKQLFSKPSMVLTEGIPSTTSSHKATLTIVNNGGDDIKVYWIDYNAKAVLKRVIKSNSILTEPTNQGSVWMVENKTGSRQYIQVNEDNNKIAFDNSGE